jgi:hypothetical protein
MFSQGISQYGIALCPLRGFAQTYSLFWGRNQFLKRLYLDPEPNACSDKSNKYRMQRRNWPCQQLTEKCALVLSFIVQRDTLKVIADHLRAPSHLIEQKVTKI